MKISNLLRSSLIATLMLTAAAFAAGNKGSFRVGTTVMVNGKQLPAGEYSVRWEGVGPQVQVSFVKGKNVVATTSAHLVDLDSSPAGDSAILTNNSDGTSSLTGIRFGGKKKALELDAAPQS